MTGVHVRAKGSEVDADAKPHRWFPMTAQVLETKLRRPQQRQRAVVRSRLTARLDAGAHLPLTVVSAPAGFGKSTLLTEWLADREAQGKASAWLSLDERDNNAVSFWRYFASAMASTGQGIGAEALSLLDAGAGQIDAAIVSLINDLDVLADDVILVLDDYHLIDNADVHAGIEFFISNAPAQVHLVLATRSDPALPLAQLRGRGQLTEVRAAELRFTDDEASQYLNQSMNLALKAPDVTALEQRTEGWIAALQLAALSMQGREDSSAFIAGFAGDDRYIVDYLAEEVLQRQTTQVRAFLLETSILDRLSGPLCDALTGQGDGRSMLIDLERRNLFLVPLDDRRQWYRYHHLFADVLRAHLMDETPEIIANLHRAASTWLDDAGDPIAAIRHALAAGDFTHAAELLERAAPAMQRDRQEALMRDWIASLPADIVRVRPVLSNVYAGALLSTGQFDQAEAPLADAEGFLEAAHSAGAPASGDAAMVVSDALELERLPAYVAVHRAGLSLVNADVTGAVAHARRALALSADSDHLVRAASAALIGLASWSTGDLVEAQRAYALCLVDMRKAESFADFLGCSIGLADIQITLGSLGEAARTYTTALQLAREQQASPVRGTADMLVGLSEVHAEAGELEPARDSLTQALALGDANGLPQFPYRRRVALARIRESEGDLEGALLLLQQALPVHTTDFSPDVRPIPAMIARLNLRLGRLPEAESWVREQGITVDDDLTYLQEYAHITLARCLLATHGTDRSDDQSAPALAFLDRLLAAAEAGGRLASVIEILVLQSVALDARGARTEARSSLQRAMVLAEPGSYVRTFTTEGALLAPLLASVKASDPGAAFARRVASAVSAPTVGTAAHQGLIDPLSERELEVLRLLSTDLAGPAIARQLFISLNTLRTHTRSIFIKLDVNSRRAAVTRARELSLIA
ncbi:MAG: LuxR C-terminal-related transcriptional regulator [Candidatus Nanopelagicales bacterium]|nr:LuxR C-terminal-related transcriptional regulator [Candidatus Nanopelagicales bacterium]